MNYNMMLGSNKRLFLTGIILVLSYCGLVYSQSTYFTFGNSKMDRGKLIYQPDPQSIILAGETEDSQHKLLFLTNMSTNGNVNWYKTYGGNISYAVNDWSITKDAGFMLSAEQYIQNDRETLYLMKLDSQGNLQWAKLFDEGGNEVEGLSITQTKDGGFIVTGLIKVATMAADIFYPIKQEKEYMYILKTDGKGNKEWSKKVNYDKDPGAIGKKVLEMEDGYLLGGVTGDTTTQKSDIFLLKISPKGDFMWSKMFVAAKVDNINNMLFFDNDLFVIGGTNSFGEGKTDAFLMRVTPTGELKWFKTYGGISNESVTKIAKVDDNTLVLAGGSQSFGKGMYDLMMLTLDKNGEVITSETFGQANHEEMGSVITSNNTLYVTGFSFASSTPKSAQAYFLSYNVNEQNKKCFFQPVKIIAKNHTIGISVKDLNKQMISDVAPSPDKKEMPQAKTIVKTETMVTETFCK